MERREFIKGSAIIGASVVAPEILNSNSGMSETKSGRKVYRVLSADKTMVGTLPVLRAFAGDNNDYVSPYVFFDEFGPVKVNPNDKPLRVDAHPHAGIIPTTYFLAGSGHHRDSLNYDFQIAKGDFMMFTSGKGAIHMEETGQKLYDNGGLYHGFQIWLNMPGKYKWIDPSTSHKQIISEGINLALTVDGSIGLEYPYFGIPVINASKFNCHINYKFNWYLRNQNVCKQYDFKIGNILLEVDGDYWHGGPGVEKSWYGVAETKIKDNIKNQVAISNGYKILRIWESEINNNTEIIINKIREVL